LGIILAEGLYDWGGGGLCPFLNYTLAFALQLRISMEKSQGREIEGLYRTRRARADRREPIRGKEYGTRIWTNRKPTVGFQGGVWIGSGSREGNGPFQGSPKKLAPNMNTTHSGEP
jgi:hypothetical protein